MNHSMTSSLYSIKKPIEDNYNLKKLICESYLGSIHQATSKLSRKDFAVREVFKDRLDSIERFSQEMSIIISIILFIVFVDDFVAKKDHPHILKVFEVFETSKKFYVVEELCEGGCVFEYISARKKVKERECAQVVRQLCLALSVLHEKGLMHKNVKPSKLLLKNKADISSMKLTDCGFFHSKSKIAESKTGFTFRSPEALGGRYMTVGDSWSVGVILYLLFSGSHPFENPDPIKSLQLVSKGIFSFAKLPFTTASLELKDLLVKLLSQNQLRRFTVEKCLQHEWINENSKLDALLPEETLFNLHKLFESIQYEGVSEVGDDNAKKDKAIDEAQKQAEKHKEEILNRERVRKEVRADEEKKRLEEEVKRRKKLEEERLRLEEEEKRKLEEDKRKREELDKKFKEEEELRRAKKEKEARLLREKQEEQRKLKESQMLEAKREMEDKRRREEEEARLRKLEEEERKRLKLQKEQEEKERQLKAETLRAENKLKRKMIMKLIGDIPQSQLDKLKQIFYTIDSDGNGTLTLEELLEGMKKFSGAGLSNTELTDIFKTMDEDNSGEVSQGEFIQAFARMMAMRNKEFIRQQFRKLDKGNNGWISSEDFKKLMTDGSLPIGDVDVNELFELIDADGDGKVDYDEFFEGFNLKN